MISEQTRHVVMQRTLLFPNNGRPVCEDCWQEKPLELHHLHYETVGNETPDDLAALCRQCHLKRHVDEAGNFWKDPQERFHYWYTAYEEMETG